MTQEQINEIVEEYRRCKQIAYDGTQRESVRKYYLGRTTALKFTIEVAGVYVKEGALLL